MRHWHGKKSQFGFLATVLNPTFKGGKNLLRVENNYFNDEGEPRTALIPFYYFPAKSRSADD